MNNVSKPVYILAIETSCDETSVAIVENGKIIRSNVISSQIETHQRYGGVVPEVASRKHVESITWMLEEAVTEAGVSLHELSAIAVTEGPGLIGALLVGVVAGKALACALDLPLIGVHHIAGHIYANQLVHELAYPSISLVVSGGHTELILLKAPASSESSGVRAMMRPARPTIKLPGQWDCPTRADRMWIGLHRKPIPKSKCLAPGSRQIPTTSASAD